ncbi:Methionine adenosyltransferase [Pyrolobus fumarii 1A]|uniref:S-adenosylmethionine synthase n=1 Tax=Pyrolobus fumarii (strain DSM 11204 / 1A) TaxID=694429 RepID=G0EEI2_PYRF1|nr:methionine adenosyltransferase [Pyrolobus fumarii]AEM38023.1 Methionine adenosyltransferase [Pyrolobus fumarii 1A]
MRIVVEEVHWQPVEELSVELVERKGVGHPDYIADAIAEAVSRELSKFYLERYGYILHHNVDKVLVVGGQAEPRFGGGEVTQPIYILVSGRVTTEVVREDGVERIPVGSIILRAAREWIRNSFRFLDPNEHVIIDYRVGRGSVDLVSVYEAGKKVPLANDTSVGVGYAPLSTLERLVYETERMLNSREFKEKVPESGEDVKVMGLRQGKKIVLTVANAMISRLVKDKDHYASVKEEIKNAVEDLAAKLAPNYDVEVHVNTADMPERNIFYITVTGTSAEAGDDGATGRGNRVNGLITPMRPMSMEAAAGKNPVSHVGKIYNVMARIAAEKIHREVKGVREVYVQLLSQIGKPITEPLVANVKILPEERLTSDMIREAEAIVGEVMGSYREITERIVRGEIELF